MLYGLGGVGAEGGSRVLQAFLDLKDGRMSATKHAPRGPFRVIKRRHGLAEIVERGAVGPCERNCEYDVTLRGINLQYDPSVRREDLDFEQRF